MALAKLDGDVAVYLDERSGDGLAVRVESGRRIPLHCTAAGKALLAALDPTVARAILERLELKTDDREFHHRDGSTQCRSDPDPSPRLFGVL